MTLICLITLDVACTPQQDLLSKSICSPPNNSVYLGFLTKTNKKLQNINCSQIYSIVVLKIKLLNHHIINSDVYSLSVRDLQM